MEKNTETPPAGGDTSGTPTPPAGEPPAGTDPPPAPLEGVGEIPESWQAELKRARAEAAKYRTKAKELEPFAKQAQEAEEAKKSEIERATEKLTAAERRAVDAEAKAMRLEVAASKGLTPKQAARLVGSTVEELEADADDLLASFQPPDPQQSRPPGQPQERLRGGGDPTDTPEPDPMAIAARVPRGY